jgi:hypothetical protein
MPPSSHQPGRTTVYFWDDFFLYANREIAFHIFNYTVSKGSGILGSYAKRTMIICPKTARIAL